MPLGVSREEVDAARVENSEALVPVADLAEAMNLERCNFARQLRHAGVRVYTVRDERGQYPRWKLAVTESDAKRIVSEMRTRGYGASRQFLNASQIAEITRKK